MAARKRASQAKEPSEEPRPKFEQALERLEGLVDQLERGDLELEESLAVFEQGVGLSKHCAEDLDAAERRIEVLIREGGEWLARPFDAREDDEEP